MDRKTDMPLEAKLRRVSKGLTINRLDEHKYVEKLLIGNLCHEAADEIIAKDDLLEMAWTIIANAHGGNWELGNDDWIEAAVKWRKSYFSYIRSDVVDQQWDRTASTSKTAPKK